MGWKNVKDYYRIERIVSVEDGRIRIGSAYVPDTIVVDRDGTIVQVREVEDSPEFGRIWREMVAGPERLSQLVRDEDHFDAGIVVYTREAGAVVECRCEVPGWPNVTHDGRLMYENMFWRDLETAIRETREDALRVAESHRRDEEELHRRMLASASERQMWEARAAKLTTVD